MILFQDAYEAAQDLLDRGLRQRVPDVVMAGSWEFPTAWVFGYNTRRFLENEADFLAGLTGGPIIVPKSGGAAYYGDGARSMEEQVAELAPSDN